MNKIMAYRAAMEHEARIVEAYREGRASERALYVAMDWTDEARIAVCEIRPLDID